MLRKGDSCHIHWPNPCGPDYCEYRGDRQSKPKMSFDEAKRKFVHRYTMEHVPAWAGLSIHGKYYAPQYKSDQEWYDNTVFPPHSGHRTHCISLGQTWPLGKWLTSPYRIGELRCKECGTVGGHYCPADVATGENS